ncbi:MAG: type II toxin-antitoxin system RelE/ParE family toxin [Clostridia bacterium]|nr:type II toxin-antitoxin system RelE/ParE family toxin [Clostridia bacterium]
MKYSLVLSSEAELGIAEIYNQIYDVSQSEEIAVRQVRKITEMIESLSDMPNRFSLWPEEPLRDLNVRFVPVRNYVIQYRVFEESSIVLIMRVVNGKRDVHNL